MSRLMVVVTLSCFKLIYIEVQKRHLNDLFLRSDSSLCPTSIVDNDSVPWTDCNVTVRREWKKTLCWMRLLLLSDIGKIQGFLCPNVLEALFTG